MKLRRYILYFLIFIICLISISSISAENQIDTNNDKTNNSDTLNTVSSVPNGHNIYNSNEYYNDECQIVESNNFTKDTSIKGTEIRTYNITSENFKTYFFNDNKLKPKYSNSNLNFIGNFNNMGVINVNLPGVNIIGSNALFNNTVFSISAEYVKLNNLKFILNNEFASNEFSGINILKSNVELNNIDMQYTSIKNRNAYGIYIMGSEDDPIYNVKLSNSKITLNSNALEDGNTYGLLMRYAENSSLINNIFNCSLPLRTVDWHSQIYGGIFMDPVVVVAIEGCDNLTLRSNNIYGKVNKRPNEPYPTLDVLMMYMCNNALLEYNNITEIDEVTPSGVDNYLYALDLYLSNNITIIANNINVKSSGGMEAHGTAYPIQVSGPASNIHIAYNNISSISHGPNIGIYSQNYYGATQISIISNYINVTGLATNHTWALVSGIEVQDSDDVILNNTIEIHNIGSYNTDYRNYGISFSQNTKGNHTYNIQYNTIISDGDMGIYLSGTDSTVDNSIIANNRIQTTTKSGDKAVFIGKGKNNIIANNTNLNTKNEMPKNMIPEWLKTWLSSSNGNGTGIIKGKGNNNNINNKNEDNINQNNNGLSTSNSTNKQGLKYHSSANTNTSTNNKPGTSNLQASAVAGSTGGSSTIKAYELNEKKKIEPLNKEGGILFGTIFVIIILMLLLTGYIKNKKSL